MGDIKVKVTDEKGVSRYIYPSSVSTKISENAATMITLEFDNPDGINASVLKFGDIIEIEDNL